MHSRTQTMNVSVPSTPGAERRAAEQMTDAELRTELVMLKTAQYRLRYEADVIRERIEALRSESVRLQQSTEVEEENAANQLFRRLDGAERDVRKLQLLLKEEEEATGDLRSQIRSVQGQQSAVMSQLDEHEEYLLVQLQKKLLDVATKKAELERELQEERQRYLGVLANQLAVLRSSSSSPLAAEEASGGEDAAAAATAAAAGGAQACAGSGGAAAAEVQPGSPSTIEAAAHAKIIALEQQLNTLLAEHAEAVQESTETERRCAELSKKLTDIQNTTFLDRARAAKLKEDLEEARSRLTDLETGGFGAESSLLEENSSFSTPCRSLEQSLLTSNASQTLKERTKELLSAAPPPSTN